MKHILYFLGGLCCLMMVSCAEKDHLFKDKTYREIVEKDFLAKKAEFSNDDLFSIFDENLSLKEREALKFLYAYMPVGDICDYDGQLYLESIRTAFKAREEMPWGADVPDLFFNHFVLPLRVNNENMDSSRMVFYAELKDRVKDLSLYDAVLEVNHWCHEKVVYRPTDRRTSAPLATMKTAYGRCGEESTFTVSALRSVGIPARQVYTPRWAHTDNNHAWVEAWVDGKWYFLGACEPEPVLNLAWFNAPVARGMLMHTRVFGKYHGVEDIMKTTEGYTEINVTSNYAPVDRVTVKVVDRNGKAIQGAVVTFKIYNYAEFSDVATKSTDEKGQCDLTAGKGDMLVWATYEGEFGFEKVSFGTRPHYDLVIDKKPGDSFDVVLDVNPPVEGLIPVDVTDDQKEENARRMQEEDRIRQAYESTFCQETEAKEIAAKLNLSPQRITPLLQESRGNWREIVNFLNAVSEERREDAVTLLETIVIKDLRDTPLEVLMDHLNNSLKLSPWENLYTEYVLNPRVGFEMLTPYKQFFQTHFPKDMAAAAVKDPMVLVQWVKDNITVAPHLNTQNIPVMPVGVWKARAADKRSRDFFFVSLSRSIGVPARIESVTRKVQFFSDKWTDVDFETVEQINEPRGALSADFAPLKTLKNPEYFSHFTISRIAKDGSLSTLNYLASNPTEGRGEKWSKLLKNSLEIEAGNYMLITGTRLANGGVLAKLSSFNVGVDKETKIALDIRQSTDKIQVIGSIDAEAKYFDLAKNEQTSILSTTGRGYFIIGILGVGQEPTSHALRNIAAMKPAFEQWGQSILLLFPNDKDVKRFEREQYGEFPETVALGIDTNKEIEGMIRQALSINNSSQLPLFVIADSFGRVVFVAEGYTIGLGEQMIKVIGQL